jgi:hypothetical protein
MIAVCLCGPVRLDPFQRRSWESQHWRQAEGIMRAAIASYTFMNTKISGFDHWKYA